jgi:hemerythrin
MTLLQWKPEYSVGIESMDDEHREMIELINLVYEELGDHPDNDRIDSFLGDIFSSISMHFALEERIMRNAHYYEYPAHKADHEKLLDQIRDLMDSFADDPDAGARELRESLSTWFSEHFSTFDARLHRKLGHH